MNIRDWLTGLGFADYGDAFAENEIDDEALRELDGDDLKELGVAKLGHRKKILVAIAALRDGAAGNVNAACGEAASPTITTDSAPTSPTATRADGDRRQVTVLFADLTGFTQLGARLDAEETHALLNAFFDIADGVIANYGGRVDKHIGDNVMAVFGAPVAHTNDPERAIRAALELHGEMPGLSKQLSETLSVHIGLASGEVIASNTGSADHQEYTVTGDSVNLASRLSDLAEAGQTLISGDHHAAIIDIVDAESIGLVNIDGLEHPVETWRVSGLRTDGARSRQIDFVGRDTQLRQFAGGLEACLASGRGESIHVRGEPGIGKSRLVEEFKHQAEARGFTCHTGQALDFGVGRSPDAIRQIVRSLLGLAHNADIATRQENADLAIGTDRVPVGWRVFLYDLLDLPLSADQHAIFDAMDNAERNRGRRETVARMVGQGASHQPLMIIAEDLHWATPSIIHDLGEIATAVAGAPALLVMTSRLEEDPIGQGQAWRTAAKGTPLTTMDLAPLHADEARQLAAQVVDAHTAFAQNCVKRAEGNPMFLEQLLRNIGDNMEDNIPASVHRVVLARVDNLDEADRDALQAASIIGQRFSLDLVQHLTGDPSYTGDGLVAHQMIRPDDGSFVFTHALIRQCVYSSMLKARVGALHLEGAQWYSGRDLILRAEHLDRAGHADAAQAYADAARAEAKTLHLEQALELVENGLAVVSDTNTKAQLYLQQGEFIRDSGQPGQSISSYEAALDTTTNDEIRCLAWIGLAAGRRVTDDYDGALAALQKAEIAAIANDLHVALSQIHYYRGNLYFPLGRVEDCLIEHQKALQFAQAAASGGNEARALSGLGDAYYSLGQMETALNYFRRCIDLCAELGLARIAVGTQYMVAWTLLYQNDVEGSARQAREAVAQANRARHQRAEMVAHLTTARARIEQAQYEKALSHVARGRALAESLGANRFQPFLTIFEARAKLASGAPRAEIAPMVREALKISAETGITFLGAWLNSTLAQTLDDEPAVQAALAEGERLLADGCVGHNYYGFYADAMQISLDRKAWDEVSRYAELLREYMSAEPLPWADYRIRRAEALARAGQAGPDGPDDETRELLGGLSAEGRESGLAHMLIDIEAALA